MALFKCKVCGSTLDIGGKEGVVCCKNCNATQTTPKFNDLNRADLYDRAYYSLQNKEYDKAMMLFKQLRDGDPSDPESYWATALCRYGIASCKDQSGELTFEVHRTQARPFLEDPDYKLVLSKASEAQKEIYQKQAELIANTCNQVLEISAQQPPVDVILICKEKDAAGKPTLDHAMATELSNALLTSGLRVFYANSALKDKPQNVKEAYTYAALNSTHVMLVIGTKPEYFNTPEVRNIWMRLMPMIRSGQPKTLVPLYKDVTPDKLPKEFEGMRSLNLAEKDIVQVIVRGVKKIISKQLAQNPSTLNTAAPKAAPAPQQAAPAPKAAPAPQQAAPAPQQAAPAPQQAAPAPKAAPAPQQAAPAPKAAPAPQQAAPAPKAAPAPQQAAPAPKAAPDTTPMLKQAHKCLAEGKWPAATECADKALRIDPKCCSAYIVKLLASLKLKSIGQLSEATVSLEKSPNYIKALECATPEQRAELEKYQQTILQRLEQAELQRQYNAAVALIKEKKYDQAIAALSNIKDYRDAEDLIKRCQEAKENAPKEAVYQKVMTAAKAKDANPDVWNKCINALQGISGYKDADDQIKALQARIEKWQQAKKEAEEKARIKAEQQRLALIHKTEKQYTSRKRTKKFFGVCTILLTALLAVYIIASLIAGYVIIPNIYYDNADDLFNIAMQTGSNSDLAAAEKIYTDLDGHEQSDKRLAAIEAVRTLKNCDDQNTADNSEWIEQAIKTLLAAGVPVTVQYDALEGVLPVETARSMGNMVNLSTASSDSAAAQKRTDNFSSETSFDKLQLPVRIGYEFDGWKLEGYVYNLSDEDPVFTLNLTADWADNPNVYKIEYDYNAGDAINNPNQYTIEVLPLTLKNPTRTGYTFVGWQLKLADGSYAKATLNYKITEQELIEYGKLSFKAEWVPMEHVITLNANGGEVKKTEVNVTYDYSYSILGEDYTPTRVGYVFEGWFLDGVQYTEGIWNGLEDIELTAKWRAINYNISINWNGGSNSSNIPGQYTVEDTVVLGTPTRVGYTFTGWTYEGQNTPNKNVVIEKGSIGDRAYTANWSANTYTITLDPGAGSVTTSTFEVKYNGKIPNLPSPTRRGYEFNGWYKGSKLYKGGDTWTNAGDLTLTAKWTKKTYSITYNLGGGTNASRNPSTYTVTDTFTLTNPTRTGYSFTGWTYDGQTSPQTNVTVTNSIGNLTFTANWRANGYTVTLNANGGTIDDTSVSVTYNQPYELSDPSRTGYEFIGWFYGNTQYSSGTWTTPNNLTLVARWQARTYNVTFQDAVPSGAEITFVYNDNVTENTVLLLHNGELLTYPAIPTRSGYLFAGWYTDESLTNYYSFSGEVTENLTLYAKWISPSYSYNSVMTAGSSVSVSLSGQTIRYYAFVPEVSGSYTIYSSGSYDTVGMLYDSSRSQLTSNDDGGSNNNFSITYNLTAGRLYYIGIKAYSSSTYGTVSLLVSGSTLTDASATMNATSGVHYVYAPGQSTTITVTFDQAFTMPVLTRTGYTHNGWIHNGEAVSSNVWSIASDATLEPDWLAATHTITLNPNGGTVSSSTVGVTYDAAYTLPQPTRTGYEFVGWFDGDTQYTSGTWTNLADLTLVARWTARTYTITYENVQNPSVNVTFVYNDGVTENTVTELAHGQTLTYPTIPTRGGYLFAGWYTDEDLTTPYSFSGDITADLTLYAKWVTSAYSYAAVIYNGETLSESISGTTMEYFAFIPTASGTVTITMDGGSPRTYLYLYNSSRSSLTYNYGYNSYSISYSVTAGQLYYIGFKYYSSGYSGNVSITVSGTALSGAAVKVNTTMGHAPGQTATQTVTYDQSFELPVLNRPGYTFNGWFNNGVQVTSGTWTTDGNMTLTPGWTANSYTITLDANGGEVSPTTIDVTYDQAYVLPVLTRTGYEFVGWFDGDTQYTSGTWTNIADLTLVARWQANTYNITFRDVIQSGAQITFVFNDEVTENFVQLLLNGEVLTYPAIPTRDGYLFAGWYTDEGLTNYYSFSGEITEDMTLYAKWIVPSHSYINQVTVGSTTSVSLSGLTIRYYAFVPEVSGSYTFTTQSTVDTYGYLYGSSLNQLSNDDDAGVENNFSITYTLTAGQLYYVGVRAYSDSTYATVTLLVSGSTLTDASATVNANSGVHYIYAAGQSASMTVTFDQEFTLPVLTRTGYTFVGWFDGDTQYTSGTWTNLADLTLVPRWTALTHTITLDANGGEVSSTTVGVTYDQAYVLPDPTRTGYTFVGWFDGDTQYTSGTWTNLADLTLVARWTANTYTITYENVQNPSVNVTFVYNDGATENTVTELAHGQTLTYPTIPTRDGYLFAGWYTDSGLTSFYGFNGSITADMTLYAKWIYPSYSYSSVIRNGGTLTETVNGTTYVYIAFIPDTTGTVNITFDSLYNVRGYLYNSSRSTLTSNTTGYTNLTLTYSVTAGQLYYIGVRFSSSSSYGDVSITVDGAVMTSTATVNTAVEHAAGQTATQTVTYDQSFELPVLSRPGYTFNGWFNNGVQVTSGTWNTTSNMTLTPSWTANTYTITFNANGGEVSTTEMQLTYDTVYELPVPTRTGYTFLGWYNNAVKYEDGAWNGTSSMTLTASWEITNYEITYELNGGTNALANPATYTIYDSVTLTAPTREGYTFLGWTYTGQETPVMDVTIALGSTGACTYTANWQANTYTIMFDANGGEVSTTEMQLTYDTVYELPTPTRTGYTFQGWYNNDTLYQSGAWNGAEDMTLTACWAANTYNLTYTNVTRDNVTITFVYNDEVTENLETTLSFGQVLTYPDIPTRDGYVFAGWCTDEALTSFYSFSGDITEDMTLYAKWIAPSYSYVSAIQHGETLTQAASGTTMQYYAFVPNTSGTVTITINGGSYRTYLYLYNSSLSSLTYSYGYNSYSISYSVTQGQLYYVGFRFYYSNYSGDISVAVNGAPITSTATVVVSTYYEAGETVVDTVTYDQSFTLPTPVRAGYTFLGWYNGLELVTSGTWTTTSDMTLTASWQANEYSLTLDPNGGEVAQTEYDITFDTAYVLPTPTRTGYTFEGWFDGDTQYTSGTWTYDSDLSLVARWTANNDISYVVNHYKENLNDDEYVLEETQNCTGTADQEITPDVKTYDGFVSPSAQTVVIAPDGTLVVNYYYDRDRITVTIITNVGDEVVEAGLKIGADLVMPTLPRDGYTIGGWYTDEDLTEELDLTIVPDEGFTVYVWWAEDGKPADFTYSGTDEITIESYIGDDTEVTIPAAIGGVPVVAIATEAFKDMTTITSITIPETVTTIGEGAFSGCTGLLAIELPVLVESPAAYTVQNDATYPWTVGSGNLISSNKDHNSTSTYTITAGEAMTVKFLYMTSSESYDRLTIAKNGVTQISASGDNFVATRYSIDLAAGDVLTFKYSKDGSVHVGNDCAYIIEMSIILNSKFGTLFGTTSGTGLTAVEQGDATYYIPSGLTEVTFTGENISAGAFENCTMLETVYTPNATSIGANAFKNCVALSKFNSDVEGKIVIPEGVTTIGQYAFRNVGSATEIVVADTVTEIGLGAFKGCNILETLTIPFVGANATNNNTYSSVLGYIFGHNGTTSDTGTTLQYYTSGTSSYYYYYIPATLTSVTVTNQETIPNGAFSNCDSLTSITLSDVTTVIGGYAFYDCAELTTVDLGESITAINTHAFDNCVKLNQVNSDQANTIDLPEGLLTIGSYAFRNASTVTTVIVPETVTSIGSTAFGGCSAITDITLPFIGGADSTSSGSSYVFGYIFGTTSGSGLVAVNQYHGTYYIPESIRNVTITVQTTIPAYAFRNCNFIESITIPEETTSIGSNAFYECNSLKYLNSTTLGTYNIPEAVTTIGDYTFYRCMEVTKVVLSENVTTIGASAFYGAFNLTEVEMADTSALTTIGTYAFSGCISLSKFNSTTAGTLNLPDGLTTVGSNAFQSAAAITTVIVPDTVTSMGYNAFGGCTAITDITLPFIGKANSSSASGSDYLFGYIFGSTSGSGLASVNQYYTTYHIPESIRNVTITVQTSIPAYAFQNCSFIESITIPEETTVIGSYAFRACSALATLNSTTAGQFIIPEGVTTINQYTFYDCDAMTKVVMSGVQNINTYAFYSCSTLEEVTFANTLTFIGTYAFAECSALEEIVLPDSVTSVASYAFYNCSALTSVTLSEGMTTINSYTFQNCTSLEEVEFGTGVQTIGTYAFGGCSALSRINSDEDNTAIIPESVITIESAAFKGCSEIYNWTLPFIGINRYTTSGTTATFGHIFGYSYSSGAVSDTVIQYSSYYHYYIPDTIVSVTVTGQDSIPQYAFQNCTFIEEITLPDDSTSIGAYAFQNCTGLERLNSTTDGKFVIPSQVTTINTYAFDGCTSMTELAGGENLTSINAYAFRNCTELAKATFGTELRTIGNYAFSGCTKLAQINSTAANTFAFPNGITSIGEYAFQNNTTVTKLIVPVSVTSIGAGAFKGCSALTDVSVPFVGASRTATTYTATFGHIFGYYYSYSAVAGTTQQYSTYYKFYIPQTITTVSVTDQYALPAYAFQNCDFITTINLLTDATSHGTNAFQNCSATVNNTLDPVIAPAWNGSSVATDFAGGTGAEDDPYVIFTGAQLAYLAQQVNDGEDYEDTYFVLGGDILLGDYAFTVIGSSDTTPFKGIIDGNGHVIRDFTLTSNGTYVGLFGYMEGTIMNLGIADATVTANKTTTGDVYAGVLVAYNLGTIENCYVKTSNITASCSYRVYAGGLVGYNAGTVEDSLSSANVNVTSTNYYAYAGGLVGYNDSDATISGSVAYGNVSAKGYNNNMSLNGGVVGYNAGAVEDCYRLSTQTLTKYNVTGSANDLGTSATVLEIREYCSTAWDDAVWNLNPNLPVLR